jgi:uncharacterized protein with PIN domain
MLGKLSRWLRIMGQDVKYSACFKDDDLISLSSRQRRILLTRDFDLFQRSIARRINGFYVEGKTEAEKLAELSKRFGFPLRIELEKSRCPVCNTRLRSTPKEEIAGEVGEKTFAHYDEFWRCPKCGQVYWQGAHWGRILSTLREAEEKLRLL